MNIDRRFGFLFAAVIAVTVSIPVLAASPSPGTGPISSGAPTASERPGRGADKDKGPETAVTLSGTVQSVPDANGDLTYSMTVNGKTWSLSAGPSWYWGDKNPLAPFVGKSVTIAGTTRGSDPKVDVGTVNGTALREPGKPPWAGGPWVVGETHPGWKPWMADGKPGNGHGRENAPGQNKASPTP